MSEKKIFFAVDGLSLEGLYTEGKGKRAAVITHPHPQMGGSMENNVVETLVAAFSETGYATLRFNFRGAGRSEGYYDAGEGEQRDVAGALDFLQGKGHSNIALAGYSFGAWVNVKFLARGGNSDRVILVSPPIDLFDLDFSILADKECLIVAGAGDPYCSVERLKEAITGLSLRLAILPGVDHFYLGNEHVLQEEVRKYLLLQRSAKK
ncbi:MAG: alpha/beta hydrolase [Smithellaceae bacterium]|nr:alpha/beta hydrolase [Smithellaceae bacterium]